MQPDATVDENSQAELKPADPDTKPSIPTSGSLDQPAESLDVSALPGAAKSTEDSIEETHTTAADSKPEDPTAKPTSPDLSSLDKPAESVDAPAAVVTAKDSVEENTQAPPAVEENTQTPPTESNPTEGTAQPSSPISETIDKPVDPPAPVTAKGDAAEQS